MLLHRSFSGRGHVLVRAFLLCFEGAKHHAGLVVLFASFLSESCLGRRCPLANFDCLLGWLTRCFESYEQSTILFMKFGKLLILTFNS